MACKLRGRAAPGWDRPFHELGVAGPAHCALIAHLAAPSGYSPSGRPMRRGQIQLRRGTCLIEHQCAAKTLAGGYELRACSIK